MNMKPVRSEAINQETTTKATINSMIVTNEDDKTDYIIDYEYAAINDGITGNVTSSSASSATAILRHHLHKNFTTSPYDIAEKPYRYDKLRGRWSLSSDFYFACTAHAFGSIAFSELPVYVLLFGGVYAIPAYLLGMILYAIPIFGIQTFLGQFSSSGVITVFRVAPIFKGLGYSIIIHNLASLTYYAVIASIPLIYAINSLYTVIPWMTCDNNWNTQNCSTHNHYDDEELDHYPHSTVEFFRSVIRSEDGLKSALNISWPLLSYAIIIWLCAMMLLLRDIRFIGKFLRCCCILMMLFFMAIFINILIQMEFSWDTLVSFMEPTLNNNTMTIMAGIRAAILMPSWLLGSGWGTILTLASHNHFKRDTEKFTYWIAFTHAIMMLTATICGRIALDHFEDEVGLFHYHVEEDHNLQFLYLCFAYLYGSLSSLPHLWCFLFFTMLFLAEFSALVIQSLTVLTALFDEYEQLRRRKPLLIIILICCMLLTTTYFCTKQGFAYLHLLPDLVTLTHLTLSILLLLITTWIYGRERFQCDLQFMLGKTISNMKIFLMRFITPAFLVISIIQVVYLLQKGESSTTLMYATQCVSYIMVPLYMLYKIRGTTGSMRQRIKQCFTPHDWYPVDAENRRFYEEIMGTSEMLVILRP